MKYIIFRREVSFVNGKTEHNKIIKQVIEGDYSHALSILMLYNMKSKRHIYEMDSVAK